MLSDAELAALEQLAREAGQAIATLAHELLVRGLRARSRRKG